MQQTKGQNGNILCGTYKAFHFLFFFYFCMQNNFMSFTPNFVQNNYMDKIQK